MKKSEVYRKAAQAIRDLGWSRGNGWAWADRPGRCVCVEGALQVALDMPIPGTAQALGTSAADRHIADLQATEEYRAFANWLVETDRFPYPDLDVWRWNDSGGRTRGDVISTLDEAADHFESIGD